MFNIEYLPSTSTVSLSGKLDSSMEKTALETFNQICETVRVDMANLDYISSAGIGVLIKTFTRLKNINQKIVLINLNDHIKEVFRISKLDSVFEIQ